MANIFHASIDEHGKISGGSSGDQTGKEVCVRSWYSKPWNKVLRYKDSSVAKKVSQIGKKLANSNLVGYDQYNRNSLYQTLKKHNFDVDAYIANGKKTETDCSAFQYACWCCLVPSMRSDSNAPTTSTWASFASKHGFTVFTNSSYTASSSKLIDGDICLSEAHHVVGVCDVGNSTSSSQSTSQTSQPTSPNFTVGNTYTLQTELKVRTGAGTNYAAKSHNQLTADGQKHDTDRDGALEAGTKVTCQAIQKVGNDIWIKSPSGWLAAYYQGNIYIK